LKRNFFILNRLIVWTIVIICILCGCENTSSVAQGTGYNNTKICWGLKKIEGKQPQIPSLWADMLKCYNGYYLGDTQSKVMYLTFDEGYENGYTSQILDILKKTNTPAAFFVTGPYIDKEENLIKRMVNEGHIVGNHTVNHPSMPDKSNEILINELGEMDNRFYKLTGNHMKFLRPPMGEFSERTMALSKEQGYKSIFWSVAYADWDVNCQRGREYAVSSVTKQFHNGAIILLHAVSVDNANGLEEIINCAKDMGYTFKSLEDL